MKSTKRSRGSILGFSAVAVLLTVLLTLTVLTIMLLLSGAAAQNNVPFDLGQITSEQSSEDSDVSGLLLPEIAGIISDGSALASSVSAATTSELFRAVLPSAAEVLCTQGAPSDNEDVWQKYTRHASTVYLRFHNEIPSYLLCSLAGEDEPAFPSAQIYEMFLMPYSESTDSVTAAVRTYDGDIRIYTKKSPRHILTETDLSTLLGSYGSALTAFGFTETGEPVFLSPLSSRDIIITNGTASMLGTSSTDTDRLLRLFDMNPDKLLNSHIASDSTGSYIDQRGILYVNSSSFSFTAHQDGGVDIENYIGRRSSLSLNDYISAAYTLFSKIGAINSHFTGGDADIILSSAESSGGKITLVFEYIFDNISIIDIAPALTAVFENGRLTEAEIYTVSARNLGTRLQTVSERWFADYLGAASDAAFRNISLVYRCDFVSESVRAEWCGEEIPAKGAHYAAQAY